MTELKQKLETSLAECPIIGIFRGVRPHEVIEIGEAAWEAGLRVMEVPLNSPNPFESIYKLRSNFGDRMIVGGGTVLTAEDARALAGAGGQICVSPNCDPLVIEAAIETQMIPMPGIATPTEAFAAVKAGAEFLKLFPASNGGASLANALREVLPQSVSLIAVGGVSVANAEEFREAGCRYLGIGSSMYRPGFSATRVFEATSNFIAGSQSSAESRASL